MLKIGKSLKATPLNSLFETSPSGNTLVLELKVNNNIKSFKQVFMYYLDIRESISTELSPAVPSSITGIDFNISFLSSTCRC